MTTAIRASTPKRPQKPQAKKTLDEQHEQLRQEFEKRPEVLDGFIRGLLDALFEQLHRGSR